MQIPKTPPRHSKQKPPEWLAHAREHATEYLVRFANNPGVERVVEQFDSHYKHIKDPNKRLDYLKGLAAEHWDFRKGRERFQITETFAMDDPDSELGKIIYEGAEVYYLVLTDGGKGSADRSMTPEALRDMRREEQRNAGKILGLKDIFFCDYPDGTLENTLEVKREVVKAIRQVKPDVVVALDPTVAYLAAQGFVNHPDHRAAGQAALDAVYPLARDHMSFPELLAEGYEPHKTKTLLLIGFDPEKATFAVDISDTLELKFQALGAHASQFSDLENMQTEMRQAAAKAGAPYAYTYAEPFVRIDIS